MKAYVFPGQGAQMEGMGQKLIDISDAAMEYMEMADSIMGFKLSKLMIEGSADELRQTSITQPAVYAYSVISSRIQARTFKPMMVAGHSLGEISALASVRAFTFAEGLKMVKRRSEAMQKACDAQPSKMAAVLGLEAEHIQTVLDMIDLPLVLANYNCPGQIIISGTVEAIEAAKPLLKEAGARTTLDLKVNGAFHSPLMNSAQVEMAEIIDRTTFREAEAPVYQNVTGLPSQDPAVLKENLKLHMISPVLWIDTIENMVIDGALQFIEVGPRPILSTMIKKINNRFTPAVL